MFFVLLIWLKVYLIVADNLSELKTAISVKKDFHNVNSPIATDASTFLEFVYNSDVYVDRSLLIKEILNVKRPLVRITYPTKWGKSTCLHMLKSFFELDKEALNNKSIEYPSLTDRPSYKYFTKGIILSSDSNSLRELQNPPLISSQDDIIGKYLGKYPVIYLDLSNCKAKNIEVLLLKIKQAFNKTYHEHSYLKDAIRAVSDSKMMNSLLSNTRYNESKITESLRFLSRMLCKYNDRKAFIFINGYDTPINEVYFGMRSKFKPNDKKRIINFTIKLLQNSFINNAFLEKGVITGVFEVLQHKCFNSTKYVKRYNLLNPSEFFALNEHEVQQIFQHVNLPADLSDEAIQWYGGYKVNEYEHSLFNPSSIAEFLKTKQLSSNWNKPALEELFDMMIKNDHIAATLQSFVKGARKSISISDLDFNEKELTYFGEIFNGSMVFRVFDEKTYTMLLSYFYAVGFLTLSENAELVKSKVHVPLQISNKEVSATVSKYIGEFMVAMNSSTTTSKTTESVYDDTYVRPVILEKEAMRISHKPRAYRLI